MEIFVISFIVYILTALAVGIGILFRGQPMHAGCQGKTDKPSCQYKFSCHGQCRRDK